MRTVRNRDTLVAIGHMDRERRPFAWFALDGEPITQGVADRLGDRQSQSGSAVGPVRRNILLLEGLEDRLLPLAVDSDSGVAHVNSERTSGARVGFRRQNDAAFVCES